MKKTLKMFLKDDHARIPFSIIGIFLILGSSFTTVYVTKLETEKVEEISNTIDFDEVENLLRYAEADIATALNTAALKGLKMIGETPVTSFSRDKCEEINRNRLKDVIMDELNVYLTGNYLYGSFNDGRYAVDVVIPDGEEYPVTCIDQIGFSKDVVMKMNRFTIPVIGPEGEVKHVTYWVVYVPVKVEVKKLDEPSMNKVVTIRTINVSTIITSRYPFLENLVYEYEDTINGVKPLWSFTTILANIYTLFRGYKHWSTGEPINVVDNVHLAPLVNGGLLMEQGFVFGSVDLMSLVDFTIESGKALRGSIAGSALDEFNEMKDATDGRYNVDTSMLSKDPANKDAGDPFGTKINDCPEINLSEIARVPLYNLASILLYFEDEEGNSLPPVELFQPTGEDIQREVEKQLNMSHRLINVEKGTMIKNETTVDKIKEIISIVYSTEMKTNVKRDPTPIITLGSHNGYPIDNGTSSWVFKSASFKNTIDKPAKGSVLPGCILYGEVYDVYWEREHYYSKNVNGSWSFYTTVDTKTEEDVTLKVILNYYSRYNGTENDIEDVFYRNISVDDENLEDTVEKYVDNYFKPNLDSLIKTGSGDYYIETIHGDYEPWVEVETWDALDEILNMISSIKQNPSINSTTYPDPVDLMEEVKKDLLSKFSSNISKYLNEDVYKNNILFKSVGKKTVYLARVWYVYRIQRDIGKVFNSVEDEITGYLDDAIPSGVGFNEEDVKNTLSGSAMDAVKNQFSIPFGLDIELRNINDEWKENVRLAVDQYPDYLNPWEKVEFNNETFYTMKLRNRCIFGPTGLPLLPPPLPWVVTMNIWVIDVEGEYAQFKVIDSSDETLFNPLFGHEPQVYVRESKVVKNKDQVIGENTRLTYGFTTVTFSIVPSMEFMVGDTTPTFWDEHTPGFK